MSKSLRILAACLFLIGAVSTSTARATSANRDIARSQAPGKGDTCRPKWPYVTLTCVA